VNDVRLWIPVILGVLQVILIPLVVTLLDARAQRLIEAHDHDPHAHADLKLISALEGRINNELHKLNTAIANHSAEERVVWDKWDARHLELRLLIEQRSPRRRAGDVDEP
jgi:hypothetical protein